MKVVQINGASINGSTGKIVSQLSEVMTQQGIENYIITSGYKEKDERRNVFVVSNNKEVKMHQIQAFLLGDAGFHSDKPTQRLINFLEQIKPDIVHLHHIYGFWLNVEKLFSYLKSKHLKVIWTLHDFWAITGHCTHFESIGCDKWKSICFKCPQRKNYPYSLFFDKSSVLFQRKKDLLENWQELEIIAVSSWVAKYASESYLKNKQITVISNGIDLDTFHPEIVKREELFAGKYIILGVAMSWSSKKGLYDFIKISKLLKKDELIILIGLSKQQQIGLPKNIIGLPRTSTAKELCTYYNIADVYVSASVEETMGLTVAEAMACGTPAVVYQETALTELIKENTGVSVPQSPESLYYGISKIREKGKKHYSSSCEAFVELKYNKWKQYKEYCNYYRNSLREQNEIKKQEN